VFRHEEAEVADDAQQVDPPGAGGAHRRPNLAGDLETILEGRPLFRTALRGYDRLQVDNYVSWAETELTATRRENDDLLSRYGTCSAELEISRRLLACSPEGRELVKTSERVGEILRLAADEAATLTEAGATEADRLRAEARAEADALLRRATEIKEAALADCRRAEEEARAARAEGVTRLQEASAEADRLIVEAAAVRDRMALEAEERDAWPRRHARSGNGWPRRPRPSGPGWSPRPGPSTTA
jgi:colicin import membrane protein